MSKHIIQYRMPFVHEVHVGIEADSEEEALQIAREQLESGQEIPVNNPLYPVFRDTLREAENATPRYTVLEHIEAPHWPKPDDSVEAIQRRHFANLASRLLVQAFEGKRQGEFDRELIEQAHLAALPAIGSPAGRTTAMINRIAVIIEGDVIQAVVADRPQEVCVSTVEYSPDGFDASELRWITQDNGHQAQALVTEHFVEAAAICLDEVFDPS